MDTCATIVATLATGRIASSAPPAPAALYDAVVAVEDALRQRDPALSTVLDALEAKPESPGRRAALEEELVAGGLDRDPTVVAALRTLERALAVHAPGAVIELPGAGSGSLARTASIDTQGGAIVMGSVNTGGGEMIGRDKVINNITIHSVDQIQDLTAVLRQSLGQLVAVPAPDALDALEVVLDEISKLYQLIDTEFTRYLSLSFDDQQHLADDRSVLLSLDGGQVQVRASEARGHCAKIDRIYRSQLRAWFESRLSVNDMQRVDQAFGMLGQSDADMSYAIHQLAGWLSEKATETLTQLDAGDTSAARRLVKSARLDAHGLRQKLASTLSTMRDIQAELLRLAP